MKIKDNKIKEDLSADNKFDEENITEDSSEVERKRKRKNTLKYVLYLVFILGVTTIVIITSLWGNADKIFELFRGMNWTYFAILCGTIIVNFLLLSFVLFLFVKLYYKHYKYHQAVANQCVGTFYNGVTPGASGGQVAQIYTFNKQGVSVSSAASVMVMSYIVYQICLIVMGIISVITHIQDVMVIQTIDLVINGQTIPIPIVIFVILGFGLNLMVIILLFVMSYSRAFHRFISVSFINFLAKIHLCKNPEKTRELVRTQVENFRVEFRRLQSNIPFTILIFSLTFVTLWITELFPFLCGLALNGFKEFTSVGQVLDDIFLSVVFTNFHQMITGLIPIPGSSGISEFVFLRLFTGYFNAEGFVENGGINAVMLLWRFTTFHIPFLLCGIVSATYKSRGIPRGERFIASDKKTYVTIQLQTYDERKASSDYVYQTHSYEMKELFGKFRKDKEKDKKDKIDHDNTNEEGK